MLRKALYIFAAIIFCVCLVNGCKKSKSDTPTATDVETTTSNYESKAEKEISKENMDDELANIEQAVEQEINQEQ